MHEIPNAVDKMAEQNFQRGCVWGLERVMEFEEDLKDWLEQRKQGKQAERP